MHPLPSRKKNTTVFWTPVNSASCVDASRGADLVAKTVDDIFIQEPVKVLSVIAQDPERKYVEGDMNAAAYKRCPGYIEYLKNMYEIRSIADITFEIDENRKVFNVIAPQWIKSRIDFRSAPNSDTHILVSLGLFTLFYSDRPVHIEQLPPFLNMTPRSGNFTVVPGTFDISKWFRPVELAIEIKGGVNRVEIKAGDPLCYVRFCTEDRSTIVLERVSVSHDLDDLTGKCLTIKHIEPGNTLEQNYARMKDKIAAFFKKQKRCPFRKYLK